MSKVINNSFVQDSNNKFFVNQNLSEKPVYVRASITIDKPIFSKEKIAGFRRSKNSTTNSTQNTFDFKNKAVAIELSEERSSTKTLGKLDTLNKLKKPNLKSSLIVDSSKLTINYNRSLNNSQPTNFSKKYVSNDRVDQPRNNNQKIPTGVIFVKNQHNNTVKKKWYNYSSKNNSFFFKNKKVYKKTQYYFANRQRFLQNNKNNFFCKLSIRRTVNNVFVTLTKFTGRIIKNFTTGSVGFKNSRKDSYYAAESVGHSVQKFCLKKKLLFCAIVLRSPLDNYIRGVIKNLTAKDNLKISTIFTCVRLAHNGTRLKKVRRVLQSFYIKTQNGDLGIV